MEAHVPAHRRVTRPVHIGGLVIGGAAPVSVQSMTNTDTRDAEATLGQIRSLASAGCEVVRMAVPDGEAADSLTRIVQDSPLPVIADIHFDYRLALASVRAGVGGLRLNPGNIGGQEKVREVARLAKDRGTTIRIGVNAGSLEKELLNQYKGVCAKALVASAVKHIRLLEEEDFEDIKVSLKASEVPMMVEAYRLLAVRNDYPLHLGVTEAGTLLRGAVKSALGIGILLAEGIGDTIRVSLTDDPVREVEVGFEILKALGLRQRGLDLISCPTCGRCQIDLVGVAKRVEAMLQTIQTPLRVAVMGCTVNGPGEARQADVGIAGGRGVGLVFRGGEIVRKVPEAALVDALMEEIASLMGDQSSKGEWNR